MRNRERIREMKGYMPVINQAEPPVGNLPLPQEDDLINKYSKFTDKYPQLGLHLTAIDRFQQKTQAAELSGDEKEALLMYSLWSEDPIVTTEIAQEVGFNERQLHGCIDRATYALDSYGNTLLRLVNDARHQAEPAKIVEVKPNVEARVLSPVESRIQTPVLSSDRNSRRHRNAGYGIMEPTPTEGPMAQTYAHPLLSKEQEQMAFDLMRKGAQLEDLMRDSNFRNTMPPEEKPKFQRVFAQSGNIEDFLVCCSLRLVDVMARGYSDDVPFKDRLNAGNIGLLNAVRTYDHTKGGRFSTIAVWKIRSAIYKEVQSQKSSIRLPANAQADLSKARRITDAFQNVFGRNPTPEELRQQLIANTTISVGAVDTALKVIKSRIEHVGSIHEKLSVDGEDEVADFIPDGTVDVEAAALQGIERNELKREIQRALSQHLTPDEERVINALYGLKEKTEKTPEQLATETGRTRGDIEEMQKASLDKLSQDKWLREHWIEEPPSFVYGMSAERAAFKLGLFRNLVIERTPRPAQNGKTIFEQTSQPKDLQEQVQEQPTKLNGSITFGDLQLDEFKKSQPFKDAILSLSNGSGIHILPDQGESVGELRLLAELAAKDIGKEINLVLSKEGGLILQLKTEGELPDVTASRRIRVIDKIKDLRNKGLSNNEIAEALHINIGSVRQQASLLIKSGEITTHLRGRKANISLNGETNPSPKRRTPREGTTISEVKRLRNEGYGNQQIAVMLGKSYGSIAQAAIRLLRRGEITPLRGGDVILKIQKTRSTESGQKTIDKVRVFRNQGMDNLEIAERLDISPATVAVYASKLIKAGEVIPLRRGRSVKRQDNGVRKYNSNGRSAFKSEETEMVRQWLEEHPLPSYKDTMNRFFEGRERNRPKGRTPKSIGFDKQVKELLDQGLTRKKMASHLGIPQTTIDASIHRMILLGEYSPGRIYSGEGVRRRAEYIQTAERVTEMIHEGRNVIEITGLLEEPLLYIQQIVWKLGRRGVINPTEDQLKPANRTGYVDPKGRVPTGKLSEVYQKVATLRQQGMGNEEIATRLGIKKHRIEIYASDLIRAGIIKPVAAGQTPRGYLVGQVIPNAELPRGKNYDKVAELRNQGLSNQQIAEQLKIPGVHVAQVASKLIRAGVIKPLKITSEAREILRAQIKELRGKGVGNTEIARKLNQSRERINAMADTLVKDGEIKPLWVRKTRKLSKTEMANFRAQVAELRNLGFGNNEIAKKLEQPYSRIAGVTYELIKLGKIQPLRNDKVERNDSDEAYKRREPYRDAILNLNGQGVEIIPEAGESLAQIRFDVQRASQELGKEVKVIRSNRNTLVVQLKAHDTPPSNANNEVVVYEVNS